MRNPSSDSSAIVMLVLLGGAGYLLYVLMNQTSASAATYAAEQASGQYSTPAQVAAAQASLATSSGQDLTAGPPAPAGTATAAQAYQYGLSPEQAENYSLLS